MGHRASMVLGAVMKSTLWRRERITAGRSFIIDRHARVWSRHCWSTRQRLLPRAQCSIAARHLGSLRETSSLAVCGASESYASCLMAGASSVRKTCLRRTMVAFAMSLRVPTATYIFLHPIVTAVVHLRATTTEL